MRDVYRQRATGNPTRDAERAQPHEKRPPCAQKHECNTGHGYQHAEQPASACGEGRRDGSSVGGGEIPQSLGVTPRQHGNEGSAEQDGGNAQEHHVA